MYCGSFKIWLFIVLAMVGFVIVMSDRYLTRKRGSSPLWFDWFYKVLYWVYGIYIIFLLCFSDC